MNPPDFLKTIYLGDRACKLISVSGWQAELKIQATRISRVRSSEGWNFYSDEDLVDGFIVFENLTGLWFDPPGFVPNDLINDLTVQFSDPGKWCFNLSIDSVDSAGKRTEVNVKIHASSIALERIDQPGQRIRE